MCGSESIIKSDFCHLLRYASTCLMKKNSCLDIGGRRKKQQILVTQVSSFSTFLAAENVTEIAPGLKMV